MDGTPTIVIVVSRSCMKTAVRMIASTAHGLTPARRSTALAVAWWLVVVGWK
jgi:hypothetical protein